MNDRSKKILFFCMFIFVIGLFFSVLIPTFQTPDEYTHLKMISESLKNVNITEKLLDDISCYYNSDSKMTLSTLMQLVSSKPSYNLSEVLPHGINLSVIKHLSCTIGILVGLFLRLPSFLVLQLGELTALIFYVVVIYFALKNVPEFENVFFLIVASPIVIQQVSSINYDAMMFPLCFLYISYVLYIRNYKEKFDRKDLLFFGILWVVISYIKVPYALLGLLLFLIPKEKIHIEIGKYEVTKDTYEKSKYFVLLLVFSIGLLGVYLERNTILVQIPLGMLLNPKKSLWLLYQTFITWKDHILLSAVGNFGWLDTPINGYLEIFIYFLIIISALFTSEKYKKDKYTKKEWLFIYGLFILMCLLIVQSMVNHTIKVILFGSEASPKTYDINKALYQIPYIGGLQGRYFLPFAMLPFMPVPCRVLKQKEYNLFSFGLVVAEIVIYICIINVLLTRFWLL